MPELPEAQTIAVELHRRLAGQTLGRVTLTRKDIVHGDPRPLGRVLRGRRVIQVYRHAKRVILRLQPEAELIFRLGMSGRLTIVSRPEPIEPHTHLRIAFGSGERELRFCDPRRFGGVWCLAGSARHVGKRLGPLGVEPLETKAQAFRKLLQRQRKIKALLMDQGVIAGLGNIYCDEALHAAGVHPLTPAGILDSQQAGRLLRAIKSTLRKAIKHNGSTLMDYRTAEGASGSFQNQHRVYNKKGKPCRRCGVKIIRMIVAGRSSFVCPQCQSH